ncbi:hypothetical protein [Viridibacillus arvi]|uniref:hypothetical protein n=1 Tax=Viridibacillus arvi TaxID=263475 RepID=UPI0034CE9DE8
MNELQMFNMIMAVIGLLGINVLIIKTKILKKNMKLWLTVVITFICYSSILIVKIYSHS